MSSSPRNTDIEKNESAADIELQQVKGQEAYGETGAPPAKKGLSAAAISEYTYLVSDAFEAVGRT